MLTIKVRTLRDPVFHDAMRRVYTSDKLPGMKSIFHIKKMVSKLDEETTRANEVYKGLVMQYRDTEADNADESKFTIQKDLADEFNAKVAEMADVDVHLDIKKIDAHLLTKVELAPAHLTVLEDVIDWSQFE